MRSDQTKSIFWSEPSVEEQKQTEPNWGLNFNGYHLSIAKSNGLSPDF